MLSLEDWLAFSLQYVLIILFRYWFGLQLPIDCYRLQTLCWSIMLLLFDAIEVACCAPSASEAAGSGEASIDLREIPEPVLARSRVLATASMPEMTGDATFTLPAIVSPAEFKAWRDTIDADLCISGCKDAMRACTVLKVGLAFAAVD